MLQNNKRFYLDMGRRHMESVQKLEFFALNIMR
jgi:hypothetical protein